MSELSVTPASQWGAKTVVVELPSGNVAEIRQTFPSYMLMRSGKLTSEMLEAFENAFKGKLEDPQLAVDMTDLILQTMFVNPKVGEGGLNPNELEDADVEFIIDRAFGGSPADGFPGQPDGAGDSGDGADVREPAVKPAGNAARKPRSAAGGQVARGKAPRSTSKR
jgi:hypothetical protein